MDKKKTILILGMFGIIFMFFGGTLSYWIWTTSSEQQTNVVFTVTKDFECAADGGGNITSADVELVPTDCTNSTYAIKREVTVTPTVYDTELSVYMDLWLDVNSLGTGLSNSTNFSYALTTSETSCTEGVISKGNFNGKTANDTVKILGKSYSASTTETYWLYIWLDKEETSSSTMNQTFDLSLNGSCTNDPYVPPEAPVLDSGMIPVTISNTGTVQTISEYSEDWYDYSNKEWANVVLVDSDSRNSYLGTTGKTVSESDILAYYVWIPRYKYRIPEIKCSDLENPTQESKPECYEAPYTISDTDKELFINWFQEDFGNYLSNEYGYTYTIEEATNDVETMLNTGEAYIETAEFTIYFVDEVMNYNNSNDTPITYSSIFNGNNTVTGPRTIDIIFESPSSSKSRGDAVNTYYTHPAFTFGSSEVSGIWVGKFETSHTTLSSSTTSNNLNCTTEDCANADGLVIKPNVSSLTYNKVSNFFYASRSMARSTNPFGLNTSTDSHMMKNSEWGAVAYLSHSQYGINYVIRRNNNSDHTTGCGATDEVGAYTDECGIVYGNATDYPQSTTGNITGIFDMAGGAYEHVMGYYSGANSNYASDPDTYFGYSNETNYAGFSSQIASKYWDEYTTMTTTTACNGEVCYGEALSETKGWYYTEDRFVGIGDPWLLRGGSSAYSDTGGAFASYSTTGGASTEFGFRSVVIVN